MSQRAKELSERLRSFGNEVIQYVENLSDQDWRKPCDWEEWTVGVVAYHMGAGHFGIGDFAMMVVRGEQLPQLSMDQVNAMSNEQAQNHADCTKQEALEALRRNTAALADTVAELSDADLDREGSMPAFAGKVSTQKLIEFVIFQSAKDHFKSMRAAVDG